MALRVDSRKCSPPMPVDQGDSHTLDRLAWGAIAVGLPEITPDNAEEWLFRFRFLEQCGLEPVETDGPMTMEAIVRWTGLTTNVSPQPRKKWMAGIMRCVEREGQLGVAGSVQ